jgi:hypothetical protein
VSHHAAYETEGPLGFPTTSRQARALEVLLKSLPREPAYAYRHLVSTRAPTELNPGERSDVSWISTESVDRMGEVVLSRGMNDSQFAQNPIVTLQHAYFLPPIGRSLWRKRARDGELVGIKAKTQYPTRPASWPESEPWPPDKVLTLVQASLMQGKSIGFLPTRVHQADQKEAKQAGYPEGTVVIDEWLLLEYACCFLPMNQDALVEQVSKGLDLAPEFLQALGLEDLKVTPEPTPAGDQGSRSFTPLSECEQAVEQALAALDLEAVVQRAVEEAFARARGMV